MALNYYENGSIVSQHPFVYNYAKGCSPAADVCTWACIYACIHRETLTQYTCMHACVQGPRESSRSLRMSSNSNTGELAVMRGSFAGSTRSTTDFSYLESLSSVVAETEKLLAEVMYTCIYHCGPTPGIVCVYAYAKKFRILSHSPLLSPRLRSVMPK